MVMAEAKKVVGMMKAQHKKPNARGKVTFYQEGYVVSENPPVKRPSRVIFADDVNNISLNEVSSVNAVVLFKGHGKDKESDRSYRTISTCPLLAKSLDK